MKRESITYAHTRIPGVITLKDHLDLIEMLRLGTERKYGKVALIDGVSYSSQVKATHLYFELQEQDI